MYRLKVPHIPGQSRGNPARDLLDGLAYVRKNSIFSFLIGMTFFNSFFGMAYVMLMPIFAVDILEVGARGQGMLLGVSGVGSLLTTLWLGSRSNVRYKGQLIIGGSILFGLTLATFAATSQLLGLFPLAMALLFFMGIFNSSYMISIQSSLQMLVPDQMRGRVMGFYGMTWSIMPLGGTQAGALANVIGAPLAIMIGGLAVVAFAAGSGLLNRSVWAIGSLLEPLEAGGPASGPPASRASTPADR
jgi:MFS family permease